MGKATKAVKRGRATRKPSPFPIGEDIRAMLKMFREVAAEHEKVLAHGHPDAKRSVAQEAKRQDQRLRWWMAKREASDICDAVAARFDADPKAVTMEDVLTLSLAAFYSSKARSEVARAVIQLSGLKVPV